ncbi:MAG: hypothetical protein IJJ45_08720 [Clostridia bacterium]|nr:hypothetical protein [Clostridia bacterium]
MASKTFAGAVAEQLFQWEYTCEFCGKRIEKTGKLTASHGFGRNVNTRWNVNAAWSQEMIAQAERKLAEIKAQTESLSQSGHWAPADDGRCPHCRKYQHWSKAAREAVEAGSPKEKQAGRRRFSLRAIGDMPAYYLFVLCLCIVLSCLLIYPAMDIFQAKPGTTAVLPIAIGCLVIGFGIPILIVKLIHRSKNRRNVEIRRSLDGAQETMPRFLSWGFHQSYVQGVN